MDLTVFPGTLSGTISAIASKSQAHRLLICAALADRDTRVDCRETNKDIEATVRCLQAMGADITYERGSFLVRPIGTVPEKADLFCGESGSTLRFLLPVSGALGIEARFHMEGRLSRRPLSPLWEEMEKMGCHLSRPEENILLCQGRLRSGVYRMPGNVSSQFISGLLFALPLIPGSSLEIPGTPESAPYIRMTELALKKFGCPGNTTAFPPFISPGTVKAEGDWSNAAFFLAAGALGHPLTVTNLEPDSPQGDRAVQEILPEILGGCPNISTADIPDLVPILAVTAARCHGAAFTDIRRLRLKESDRVKAVCQMLSALGCSTEADENTLTVFPGSFQGCTIDSFRDHRIAMAGAIAGTLAQGPVTILNAECVRKSYPGFWEDFKTSGGRYEQYIR